MRSRGMKLNSPTLSSGSLPTSIAQPPKAVNTAS